MRTSAKLPGMGKYLIWVLLAAAVLTVAACGASQGSASGHTLSNEAGTNALDSDGDGLHDERVFVGHESDRRQPPPAEGEMCGDGEDNDGDTDVDCDDAECAMLPACAE